MRVLVTAVVALVVSSYTLAWAQAAAVAAAAPSGPDYLGLGTAAGQTAGLLIAVKWLVGELRDARIELGDARKIIVGVVEKSTSAMAVSTAALEKLSDRLDRAEEDRRRA